MKQTYLLIVCNFMIALMMCAPCAQAQQGAGSSSRLGKIEFTGLKRYSQEEAAAASGLRIGQSVDEPTLDAAAKRLLGSGLFARLSYRYRTTGGQGVVTFTVEEAQGSLPVIFDNFVWFTDEELFNAIRKEMPTFDGKAAESGGAIESLKKALENLLRARKIPGQIEHMPEADRSTGESVGHIFSIVGANIPLCAIRFPGAANVPEGELIKNSKPLFENSYSRKFVTEFAQTNLIPIYRQRGHLRASFQTPLSTLEGGSVGDCKDGVAVTLPVEEGLIYNWDKAEWEGNQALAVAELENSLGMKSGELADGVKIDAGLDMVRSAYGKKGFILTRLKTAPAFDDANRRVSYHIKVSEGAQFRMGNLVITGLSEPDANRLRERWKLRPGDVYDGSYLREFVKEVIFKGKVAGVGKKVEQSSELNREKLTVDVSITFK